MDFKVAQLQKDSGQLTILKAYLIKKKKNMNSHMNKNQKITRGFINTLDLQRLIEHSKDRNHVLPQRDAVPEGKCNDRLSTAIGKANTNTEKEREEKTREEHFMLF